MKECSKCKLLKPYESFYARKTGIRNGQYYEKCKDCYKSRGRNYYHENRDKQLELAKLRKLKYIKERKNFLNELKNKPCTDCGVIYPPWVMDFDHREGSVKIENISKLAFRKVANFDKIKEEIEKCDLVCSNCHRQRTYERMHQ